MPNSETDSNGRLMLDDLIDKQDRVFLNASDLCNGTITRYRVCNIGLFDGMPKTISTFLKHDHR